VAAVAVAVVTAVGAGGRWVTHPTALEPVANGLESPVRVGDSAVIGMFAQPTSGQVRLVSAEPVITESANATVRVLLCTDPTELPEGTTLGSDRGRAEQVCARTRPARDAPLGRVQRDRPYLVVEVTPRAPGAVTVEACASGTARGCSGASRTPASSSRSSAPEHEPTACGPPGGRRPYGRAVLLLLNGAPGVGTSTLARRFVADRPLALDLDLDLVRALLGRWDEWPQDSGRLARDLALVMVRQHLAAGHDVVVPQAVGRLPFVERLAAVAQEVGVRFAHVLLREDRERAVARFETRSRATDRTDQHAAAAELAGGRAGLLALHDAVLAVAAARPDVLVVPSTDGDVEATDDRLLAALAGVGEGSAASSAPGQPGSAP
jgi:predicted kinase